MNDSDGLAAVLVLGGYIVGAVIGGFIAWTYAPPVGGEFWPYIRVLAALLGAVIGAKAGMLLAALGALVVAGIIMLIFWVVDR